MSVMNCRAMGERDVVPILFNVLTSEITSDQGGTLTFMQMIRFADSDKLS